MIDAFTKKSYFNLFHYQKFAKYQRIYQRNISVGNLRSKLPTDTFPSVLQSGTTDGIFFVRNSVGNYRQKFSVGSCRLNYGRKSFRIKKKGGSLTWRFWRVMFFWRNHRRIQNDSPYSDVTGSPFKLPTDSPRDLKWQIRTVTCLCFRQNHRRFHRWNFRRWNRRKKLIYDSSGDPLLPYFSFFFLIPTLLTCKQPAPPPPQINLPHISTTSYISWSFVVTASVFWFTDGFYQFL
jgi:hypothetical protein